MPKRLLVTGSSGLIGSEVCLHFARKGWEIHGVDNNQRAVFFGPAGDTRWNQARLSSEITSYQHHEVDIRDRPPCCSYSRQFAPDAIVHTAAQPSHDRAAAIPFDDFDTNAVGTFNLLEATRQSSPKLPLFTCRPTKSMVIVLTRSSFASWRLVGTTTTHNTRRNRRRLFHRSVQTQLVWCEQGSCGYRRAGVWTLLQHANRMPSRRLFDWPEP